VARANEFVPVSIPVNHAAEMGASGRQGDMFSLTAINQKGWNPDRFSGKGNLHDDLFDTFAGKFVPVKDALESPLLWPDTWRKQPTEKRCRRN